MRKHSDTEKGFTLVELLLATAILAVVLVGLVKLFIHCSFLAELSINQTTAVSIAQSKMEEIRGTYYTSIVRIHAPNCPCLDGDDNDADGSTDYPSDTGCRAVVRDSECSDGIDNDGNGLIDYPADSGCSSANDDDEGNFASEDTREDIECSDGIDNDGNGLIDFTGGDTGCASSADDDEGYLPSVANGACTGTFTVTELNGASGAVSVDHSNPEILEAQVVVIWANKGGRSSSVTLTSVISKR